MKPKISIITLAVSDLEKSVAFYRSLGFETKGDFDSIAFFVMGDMRLALYPKEKLPEEFPGHEYSVEPGGFTLAHNVASKEKVDEVLAFVEGKGANIIKKGQEVFWGGYSGYFADPEGFLWEVAYNPYEDLT